MAEFKKKSSNKFWYSPLMLMVFFIVLILFAYSMVGLIKKENETSKKKALILDEIKNLNQRKDELTKNINDLQTDQGKEQTIRDKYQVVKPGEKMVVIVDEDSTKQPEENVSNSQSFWLWLKNLFN